MNSLSAPAAARQIDTMTGEAYRVLVIDTRPSGLFPGCVTHDLEIGRGNFTQRLVIHAQGVAPGIMSVVKRKRLAGGYAVIWADASGRVTGGGFTTACVPADWRAPAKTNEGDL